MTVCRELGEEHGNENGDLGDTFCQPLYREFQARLTMYLFTSRFSARHVLEKIVRVVGSRSLVEDELRHQRITATARMIPVT